MNSLTELFVFVAMVFISINITLLITSEKNFIETIQRNLFDVKQLGMNLVISTVIASTITLFVLITPTQEVEPVLQSIQSSSTQSSSTHQKIDRSIDVCRCLTEPGNSKYMQENGDACREAISKEIGVDNWEKVNFSKNAELSARFDALERKCL